jgi:hypothetical protein
LIRSGAFLLAAFVFLAATGCAHRLRAPSGWQWGIPVYPDAELQGKSTAKASFFLYRTTDSIDDVYAWYVAELPPGTPHAYSAAKHQATLALFDPQSQRTVHIQQEGPSTAILLTKLNGP